MSALLWGLPRKYNPDPATPSLAQWNHISLVALKRHYEERIKSTPRASPHLLPFATPCCLTPSAAFGVTMAPDPHPLTFVDGGNQTDTSEP